MILNTGSFNSGDTAYLYVITENGTAESFDVNANGFPVTIGETGTSGGGEPEEPEETPQDGSVLVGYDLTP